MTAEFLMLFLTKTLCQPEIEPSTSPTSGNTRLTCAGIIDWNFNHALIIQLDFGNHGVKNNKITKQKYLVLGDEILRLK